MGSNRRQTYSTLRDSVLARAEITTIRKRPSGATKRFMNEQEQEAQNGQNTNTPAGEQTIKDLVGNFTPVPNSVLDSPTLSSNAKVVFGDLLATYLFARDTNQLVNGSFYRATNAIAERMDISPSQIRNAVLPELYDAGLVEKCDERRDVHNQF